MTSIFKFIDNIIGFFKTFTIVAMTLLLISLPKFIVNIFSKAINWIKGG